MWMKRAADALRFMTVLPVGDDGEFRPREAVAFFPVTGLVIGALVSAFDWAALHLWPPAVVSVLDVVFLAAITGALHLDGLADTADGLFSHRSRERALEIMKDSRIGVMGAVSILAVLMVKAAGIGALGPRRALVLMVVPALARAGILVAMKRLPYGRPEGGTGRDFFTEPLRAADFWAVAPPLILAVFAGWAGLWLVLGFGVAVGVLAGFYRRKMGCVTGDMLGALVEVTEAVLFMAAAVSWMPQ